MGKRSVIPLAFPRLIDCLIVLQCLYVFLPQGLSPKPCEGNATASVACNTNPCDMQWSEWSECSASCGRGNRLRYTMCAEEAGGNLTDCGNLGLVEQAFDHVVECNTWDRKTCRK